MGTFDSTGARWARIVRAQAASGLSVAAFCARRGLAVSTFYPWKRRLASAAEPSRAVTPAPAFVEATLRVDDPHGQRGVTVVLSGGRRIAVGPGFDRRLLLEVVEALESGAGVAS